MTLQQFQQMVSEGVVLLDGAMGSNLRRAGMPVGVSSELWALEHPDILTRLQRGYVDAGSQIVYAPTFSANRMGLALHGLEDRMEEINRGLVALTRRAADGRAWVAGNITTTGKALEPRGDMTYQGLFDLYREQVKILADAGADLIVAETMLSLDETVAALDAALSACNLPVVCTMTLQADGNLFYGGSSIEAVETLQAMGAAAVGLNCSVGPDQLESVVRSMKSVAAVPVVAKPNAGLPTIDAQGVAHYSMSPEDFAVNMGKLVRCGARIVGGCCGTDPEYIRRLAETLRSANFSNL